MYFAQVNYVMAKIRPAFQKKLRYISFYFKMIFSFVETFLLKILLNVYVNSVTVICSVFVNSQIFTIR